MNRWFRIRFLLCGSFHCGWRKWGYVRSSRPYLPGWTLWGAIVVYLKRYHPDWAEATYSEIGNWVDHNFWLSHLYFVRNLPEDAGEAAFLPFIDEQGSGRTLFAWRKRETLVPVVELETSSPLGFRHGVVRGSGGRQGNLYLTETAGGQELEPLAMEGYIFCRGDSELPLSSGDCLTVGGSRTVTGAVLSIRTVEEKEPGVMLTAMSHLAILETQTDMTGAAEQIVLRRTSDAVGGEHGFGATFIDWGLCLQPGWQNSGQGLPLPLVCNGSSRHGVLTRS